MLPLISLVYDMLAYKDRREDHHFAHYVDARPNGTKRSVCENLTVVRCNVHVDA